MSTHWKELKAEEKAIKETQNRLRRGKVEAAIEIGKQLVRANTKLANHGDGTFSEWCRKILGIPRQRANEMMAAYRTFKDCPESGQSFDKSALIELSKPSTPAELVEEAKELARGKKPVTYKWVKDRIKELNPPPIKKRPTSPYAPFTRVLREVLEEPGPGLLDLLKTDKVSSELKKTLETFVADKSPTAARLLADASATTSTIFPFCWLMISPLHTTS